MPTITLSVSLGEILLVTAACALGIVLFVRCRGALRAADPALQNGSARGALIERIETGPKWQTGSKSESAPRALEVAPETQTFKSDAVCGHDDAFLEHGDLVSKLAVAVSMIVSHAEAHPTDKGDQGAQLLDALRESCLAIVESIWLRDLDRAYEDSKNRRVAVYKHSRSVAELREKIEKEDRRLREAIDALSSRLEQVLDTSHGRYARASDKLTVALQRILE